MVLVQAFAGRGRHWWEGAGKGLAAALTDEPSGKLGPVQGTGLGCHLETASEPRVASLELQFRDSLGADLC